jgi:hypothetical protein
MQSLGVGHGSCPKSQVTIVIPWTGSQRWPSCSCCMFQCWWTSSVTYIEAEKVQLLIKPGKIRLNPEGYKIQFWYFWSSLQVLPGLCKVWWTLSGAHLVCRIAVIRIEFEPGKAELNEFEKLLSAVLAGEPWLVVSRVSRASQAGWISWFSMVAS